MYIYIYSDYILLYIQNYNNYSLKMNDLFSLKSFLLLPKKVESKAKAQILNNRNLKQFTMSIIRNLSPCPSYV